MLFTSYYEVCDLQNTKFNFYSISGDRGRRIGFNGNCYCKLAPKKSFWKVWHDNIGKVPNDDNDKFYIEHYWKQVLSPLNAGKIYEELNDLCAPTILLCYENHSEFCHRHIVSAWLELATQEPVSEVKINEKGQLAIVEKPYWIKEHLQQIINTPT